MADLVHGTAAEANASVRHGWVMGPFMEEGANAPFEVKLWRYDEQPDYPWKRYDGKEFIVIYGGTLHIEIRDEFWNETIVLRGQQHDYVILPPGTEKRVFVVEAPAFGVTVRYE